MFGAFAEDMPVNVEPECLFVAVGSGGRRVVSKDGINWFADTSGGDDLRCIAYGNKRFVAAGFNGRRVVSTDGINWSDAASIANVSNLFGITYGNGRFVAVGYYSLVSKIFVSTDGINWSDAASTPSGPTLYGIAYGKGRFVAVCNEGTLSVSTDGVNWSDVVTSGATLYAVTSNSFKVEAPDN